MKAIINAKVVTESGILWDGVILTEGVKIAVVGKKRYWKQKNSYGERD